MTGDAGDVHAHAGMAAPSVGFLIDLSWRNAWNALTIVAI